MDLKITRYFSKLNILATSVAAILVIGAVSRSEAAPIVLTDGGSTAMVDPNSSAGMFHWDLGGASQLNQQWFWYRIGGGLAQPINTISTASVFTSGANFLETTYTSTSGPLFSIVVSYTLVGGGIGSGTADIQETISIKNLSGSTLNNFNFFQYSDFNLLGTPGNDSVSLALNSAVQNNGASGIGEVVTQPDANRAEAGFVPTTLNNLNTIAGYNLNNVMSAGVGDVAWAFQWTTNILAGDTFDISKDKIVTTITVPEPTTLALFAAALGACSLLARRRSRN